MTISRVGTSTGTNTATPVAHAIGDIIVYFAFRNTTGTPGAGAGYTSPVNATKVGTVSSARVAFKIATATSGEGVTFANATSTVCHVYRSSLYATGGSLFIGDCQSSSSTTNTVTYPALTLKHGDNTSWALGFGGVGNLTETIATAPSGMTNQSLQTSAATQSAGHDTNGTVSSWSSTNAVTTGTAGNSVSFTLELMENQPGTILNNLVQHISFAYQDANASAEIADNYVWQFDPTLASNGLLFAVQYQDAGHTPSISDDKGNTWGAADVTAGITGGGTVLALYHINNAITGTSQINLNFGGNPQNQVRGKVTQLYNVTGTVEGTATSGVSGVTPTGGIVAAGAYTPSTANCIIFTYIMPVNNTLTANPALIVSDTNCVLNDGDNSWGATGWADGSQYTSQTSAVSYTPRMFINAVNVADGFHIVSMALSTGAQGTLPATGPGNAPWLKKLLHFGTNSSVAAMLMQIPSEGNGGVFKTFLSDTGVPHLTSMIDNDSVTWTLNQPGGVSGNDYMPTRFNSAQRTNRTITANISGTGQNIQFIFEDWANLATSGTIVASAGTTGSSTGATITPTGPNQATTVYLQIGTGPSASITAPSGAVYDLPTASTWVGTGSIAATTLTKATDTWGGTQFNNGVDTAILSGAGISGGTCPVSGTGPTYTINPNNGVIATEAMALSTTDTNTMNWGNGAGHYYNGNSTAAQAWNFVCSQNTVGTPGGKFSALILAGPPAGSAGGASQAGLFAPRLGPGIDMKFSPNFGPSLAYPAAVITVTVTFKSGSTLPMMGVG